MKPRVLMACLALALITLATPAYAEIWWIAPNGPGGTYVAYQRNSTALSWSAAQAFAAGQTFAGQAGHLPSVTTGAENDYLFRRLGTGWIGLTDDAAFGGGPEAGDSSGAVTPINAVPTAGQRGAGFVWVNGEAFSTSRWNGGEPNNSGTENFIELVSGGANGGVWNDLPGGATRASTIEYNLGTNAPPTNVNGLLVTVYKAADGSLDTDNGNGETDALLASIGVPGTVLGSGAIATTNLHNTGGDAAFGSGVAFPGTTIGTAVDNAAVHVTGTLNVAAAGDFQFRIQGDDGGRIRIDGQTVVFDDSGHGDATSFTSPTMRLAAGSHTFEWVNFEGGGGWTGEASYDQVGVGGGFVLFGDASEGITASNLFATTLKIGANVDVTNMAVADGLINGTIQYGEHAPVQGIASVINMFDPSGGGGTGNFGGDDSFLGVQGDDFVVHATGLMQIPLSGNWTFGTNTDDGSRLIIDGTLVKLDDVLSGPHDHLATFFLEAGYHTIDFTFFERASGAEAELFAALGSFGAFNPTDFRLLGDPGLGINLFPVNAVTQLPEPGTVAMWTVLGAAAAAFAWRKRSRRK